jgi:hypothetical protein
MSWICPHCGTTATLQTSNVDEGTDNVLPETATDNQSILISWFAVKCPRMTCCKFVMGLKTSWGRAEISQVATGAYRASGHFRS